MRPTASKHWSERVGWLEFNCGFTQIWWYCASEITSYNHWNIQSVAYEYESVIQLVLLIMWTEVTEQEETNNITHFTATYIITTAWFVVLATQCKHYCPFKHQISQKVYVKRDQSWKMYIKISSNVTNSTTKDIKPDWNSLHMRQNWVIIGRGIRNAAMTRA